MRLFPPGSGPTIGGRLLFAVTVVAIVAACGGSAAAPAFGNAAGANAPYAGASAAPAGSAGGGTDSNANGAGGSGGSGGNGAPVDEAKIVRTGSLQMTVDDVDGALRTARDAVRALGGYLGASQQQRTDDRLIATITYRIPVARWEDALDAISKLGTVIGEQTAATEVTGQLVDLDARIRNLKASEAALVGYAKTAPKVSDLLEIESRLTETRGEIERLSGQQASLADQVALATLTVSFGTEVVAVTRAAAQWDPAAEVDRASATLIKIVQGVISLLIVIAIVWLPILLVLGVVLAIAIVIARRLGWRRAGPLPPGPPVAPPAPAAEG